MKTIKIAGISGVGKSTLMEAVTKSVSDTRAHGYSWYLKKYGADADAVAERDLMAFGGISLMDEHLELGDGNLGRVYVRENTRAIVLIEVSVSVLMERRRKDSERVRSMSRETASKQQALSVERAYDLARRCDVQLLHLRDLKLSESCEILGNLCCSIK